jgi:hypothetical protein
MVDRDEPQALCPEWHGDGTADEDNRGSPLAVMAPARAMGEARPRHHEPRWQAAAGGAAAGCRRWWFSVRRRPAMMLGCSQNLLVMRVHCRAGVSCGGR